MLGGHARRFCGDASEHNMSVTLLRNHSWPQNMARHRALRRGLESKSAKLPRRLCLLGLTDWKCRDAACADTTFVDAGRPCKALLWGRVRT